MYLYNVYRYTLSICLDCPRVNYCLPVYTYVYMYVYALICACVRVCVRVYSCSNTGLFTNLLYKTNNRGSI